MHSLPSSTQDSPSKAADQYLKNANLLLIFLLLMLMTAGISTVWQELMAYDPQDVCRRAMVKFDASAGCYTIPSFGQEVVLSPKKQFVTANGLFAKEILPRIQFYAQIAFPFYLVHAQDQALSGQYVNPRALKGGDFFARGTHALPLEKIATKYGSNVESFREEGKLLCGAMKNFGDASWVVHPLPRVPVLVVLWRGDEEFPPRAEVLLDQTPTTYLPIDILWAVAMMCINTIL